MRTLMTVLIAAAFLAGCAHSTAAYGGEVRGDNLRQIIENQILDNVRESYGELEGQNFSDADRERFFRDHVPDQIVALLRADPKFKAAVGKVRDMPSAEAAAYLKRCRLYLRKTWAELGEISRKGTTEAGRVAELAISNAIVDLAEKMISESAKSTGGNK